MLSDCSGRGFRQREFRLEFGDCAKQMFGVGSVHVVEILPCLIIHEVETLDRLLDLFIEYGRRYSTIERIPMESRAKQNHVIEEGLYGSQGVYSTCLRMFDSEIDERIEGFLPGYFDGSGEAFRQVDFEFILMSIGLIRSERMKLFFSDRQHRNRDLMTNIRRAWNSPTPNGIVA